MREHLSKIRVNDVAAQAVEINKLGLSASKWISLLLLVVRIGVNVLAVLSNFRNQVINNEDEGSDRETEWISTSRDISVWSELGIMAFLVFVGLVLLVDLIYSLTRLTSSLRNHGSSSSDDERDQAAAKTVGGVVVAQGDVLSGQDETDWKDRAGEAAKFYVRVLLAVASFSLLQFIPSLQKLKDLPSRARTISRYVARKVSSDHNPLVRERRWSELSFGEALVLFIGFGILQTFLFALGVAALFVKLSQVQFIVETSLVDWSTAEFVSFIGFLNNLASITNIPEERASGALRVIFAGTDGRLDNLEWRALETWRNFFSYRVLVSHNLFYGIAILTQSSSRDLQSVLIAEKESEPIDLTSIKQVNAFDQAARINVFGRGSNAFAQKKSVDQDSEDYTYATADYAYEGDDAGDGDDADDGEGEDDEADEADEADEEYEEYDEDEDEDEDEEGDDDEDEEGDDDEDSNPKSKTKKGKSNVFN